MQVALEELRFFFSFSMYASLYLKLLRYCGIICNADGSGWKISIKQSDKCYKWKACLCFKFRQAWWCHFFEFTDGGGRPTWEFMIVLWTPLPNYDCRNFFSQSLNWSSNLTHILSMSLYIRNYCLMRVVWSLIVGLSMLWVFFSVIGLGVCVLL